MKVTTRLGIPKTKLVMLKIERCLCGQPSKEVSLVARRENACDCSCEQNGKISSSHTIVKVLTWKQITTSTTRTVASKLEMLGAFCLHKACQSAWNLFCLVNRKWKRAIIAPSNSAPCSVRIVIGEKLFQRIISQMFVAMNKETPLPRPQPFCKSSSRSSTIIPAIESCTTIRMEVTGPMSDT